MLKLQLHKRFIRPDDSGISAATYRNSCAKGSGMPVGIQEDNQHKRPDCVHS